MKVGASGVHAFVGLNGPYWQDSDSDGDIDSSDTPQVGALGLAVSNLEFGLALMEDAAGATSYYALKGQGAVELVGVAGVDLAVPNLLIEVNGTTGADPNLVVDFAATFPEVPGTTPAGMPVSTGPGADDLIYLVFDTDSSLVRAFADEATLTIAGVSTTADLFFERTTRVSDDSGVIKVAVADLDFTLFGGLDQLVTITNGQGLFLITDDGMAGAFSVSVAFHLPLGLTISAQTVSVAINNTNVDVHEEFHIPGDTEVLDVAAGPYVRVEANTVVMGVTVNGTLYGLTANVFQLEQITLPDTTEVVKIAASGLHTSLPVPGGNDVLDNGWGGMILYDDGVAAMAKGNVALFSGAVEGEVAFFMNSTSRTVDDTITIRNGTADVDLRLDIAPNTIGFSATNAVLRFGDYFVLRGDYTMQVVGQGTPNERTLIGATQREPVPRPRPVRDRGQWYHRSQSRRRRHPGGRHQRRRGQVPGWHVRHFRQRRRPRRRRCRTRPGGHVHPGGHRQCQDQQHRPGHR